MSNRAMSVLRLVVTAFLVWQTLGTEPIQAATNTIVFPKPGKDATIKENSPNQNFGGDSLLRVISWGPGANLRLLVRFSITGAFDPALVTITRATLELCLSKISGDNSERTYGAHQVSPSWEEPQVTANDRFAGRRWTTFFGDFDPTPTATVMLSKSTRRAGQWVQWDVTADILDIVYNGANNNGWLIRDATENHPTQYKTEWVSEESSSTLCGGQSWPRLIVEYETVE